MYKGKTVIVTAKNRISFYKWQWTLLQNDDEVVKRTLTLIMLIPPKLNIVAPTLKITKP